LIYALLSSLTQRHFHVKAKPPNARIKLPDINTESHPSDHDKDASSGQLE
jgi:hypothetical protein